MKKKLVSVLLTAAMATTMLAGCGNSDSTDTTATEATSEADTTATEGTEAEAVEAEAIPEAVYYYSFDAADDSDSIHAVNQDTTQETSATKLTLVDGDKTYIPGVKGDALYVNGNTGYKLTDVNGVGDTYTVSFWVYSTRFSDYMPSVQFGPDVYGDNTGCANWMNITKTTFSDDAVSAFPTIWSRNETDDTWPFIVEAEGNDRLKEWTNITISVDGTRTSADGTMLIGDLYINGELLVRTDADGNVAETLVAKGCMDSSDYFDFLIGVNYWDSIFKGAFDELYIFDQALTAGQALTLYQMGDPTVEFEEPDRDMTIKPVEDALYTLGNYTDRTADGTDFTPTTEIKDGDSKKITLKNYSDIADVLDNFSIGFVNEESTEAVDPKTVASDNFVEWATICANLTTTTDNVTMDTDYDISNWNTWLKSVMIDADVTVIITRSGSDLIVDFDFVDWNGNSTPATATIHTALTAEDPCYFYFTNVNSYVEIYSIKRVNMVTINPDASAVATVGDTGYGLAFWGGWTESYELANGATKTIVLNNYSSGAANWDNYVIGFENQYNDGTASPNDGTDYLEYAVVRADIAGWDDATFEFETSWSTDEEWETWLEVMKSATVTLVFSRTDNVITIDATAVSNNGFNDITYTWKSTVTANLLGADDPLYFFITGEACYIEVLSVE